MFSFCESLKNKIGRFRTKVNAKNGRKRCESEFVQEKEKFLQVLLSLSLPICCICCCIGAWKKSLCEWLASVAIATNTVDHHELVIYWSIWTKRTRDKCKRKKVELLIWLPPFKSKSERNRELKTAKGHWNFTVFLRFTFYRAHSNCIAMTAIHSLCYCKCNPISISKKTRKADDETRNGAKNTASKIFFNFSRKKKEREKVVATSSM